MTNDEDYLKDIGEQVDPEVGEDYLQLIGYLILRMALGNYFLNILINMVIKIIGRHQRFDAIRAYESIGYKCVELELKIKEG
jgi:hypothetical protein